MCPVFPIAFFKLSLLVFYRCLYSPNYFGSINFSISLKCFPTNPPHNNSHLVLTPAGHMKLGFPFLGTSVTELRRV